MIRIVKTFFGGIICHIRKSHKWDVLRIPGAWYYCKRCGKIADHDIILADIINGGKL